MNELWNRRGASKLEELEEYNVPTSTLLSPSSPMRPRSISSPLKSPLCNRGKTMRDYEEELITLRKENFDLKMRVYVLNDQMELFQSVENADQLYEVNANLKKEVEKLKYELSDKEDLVLGANEAMNILGAKHRDEVSLLKGELDEKCSNLEEMNLRLQKEIERLMLERNEVSCSEPTLRMEDSNAFYAMAFASLPSGSVSKQLEVENLKLEEDLAEKLKLIDGYDKIIREQQEIIEATKKQQKKLEMELESKTDLLAGVHKDLREKEHACLQLCRKAHELEEQLSVRQLQIDNLKTQLASNPTNEVVKNLQTSYERCNNENGILADKINELKKKLEDSHLETESQASLVQEVSGSQSLLRSQCKSIKEEFGLKSKLRLTRDEVNGRLATTIKALVSNNKALTMDIEALNKKLSTCVCSGSKDRQTEGENVVSLPELIVKLENEKTELNAKLTQSVEERDRIIQEYEKKLANTSNDRVEDLERQLSKLQCDFDNISLSRDEKAVENDKLSNDLQHKNEKIDNLNEELRKRTFYLQELVNKELWSKNREIEKLNKSCEKKGKEIAELKERLTKQNRELCALTDKMQALTDQTNCENSAFELQKRLCEEVDKRVKLENDVDGWKNAVEESEKTRKGLANACCLFTARLEELATFLESLLPLFGSKKRKILQDAIDRSREASRTLSNTIVNASNLTVPILPDFSQVDFFSDNDIDITVDVSKSKTDKQINKNDPKLDNNSVCESLSSAVGGPKKSWKIDNYVDRFDFVKLACMSSSFNIEEVSEVSLPESFSDSASVPVRQSSQDKAPFEPAALDEDLCNDGVGLPESEGWSEPDRDVSLARIGLRVSSLPIGHHSSEELSDESLDDFGKISSCKRRCDAAKIRRLRMKVRSLEKYVYKIKASEKSRTRSPPRDCLSTEICDVSDRLGVALADLKKRKADVEEYLVNNKPILNKLTGLCGKEPTKRELCGALSLINSQFEMINVFLVEMDEHYLAIEKEKEAVTNLLAEKEKKIDNLNTEITSLQADLKEKENEILEKQCALLGIKNNYIVLDNKCKAMETSVEEMNKWKTAVHKSKEEREALKESYVKEINDLKTKLVKAIDERNAEVSELKSSLDRAFKRIDDVCLKKVLLETEFKQKVDSLQKEKRFEVEQEVVKRIDVERKLVEAYEMQSELRKQIEEEVSKSKDVEMAQKSSERWWRRRTEEMESTRSDREAELRRRLDNATIATSQAVLERTRLANEKIRLQCELRRRENCAHDERGELEQRVLQLEETNKDLMKKLQSLRGSQVLSDLESPPPFSRQRSNPTSDYTSDPDQHENKGSNGNLNHWFPVCGRSNNNCSPDLGIESDHGKLSSLDPPIGSTKTVSDIERENVLLRRELARKSRLLEEGQRNSKMVKEKLENKIYSEIGKTHDLIEKTRLKFQKAQI